MTDQYKSRRKPRPHIWRYPFDQVKTNKHMGFLRARAQCAFRNEPWTITPEQWQEIWPDALWLRRGRNGSDLCLTRRDPEKDWTPANVYIVTRRLQLILQKPRNHQIETHEVEPMVWDITGETLRRHLLNQARMAPYKGRYKK